ncbi:MAG: sigma-70 family RNA polymerase sigma factor [Acidobacteriota bacterium]
MPIAEGTDGSHITRLLHEWNEGRPEVLDELMPLVYGELHRLAAAYLRSERSGHTLQPTALVNEAYLRLTGGTQTEWHDRRHFFAVAATAMRHILVDHARAKHRDKRGGKNIQVLLHEGTVGSESKDGVDLIALDEALVRLAKLDRQQASVVELKFFAGLTLDQTADALNISRATVAREWESARVWLFRELTK